MKRSKLTSQLAELVFYCVEIDGLGPLATTEVIIKYLEELNILPPQPVGTNFKATWDNEDTEDLTSNR